MLHRYGFRGVLTVRRDGAAGDDPPEKLHVRKGDVQEFAADVVVKYVDAVGGEALDGVGHGFFLVVEA